VKVSWKKCQNKNSSNAKGYTWGTPVDEPALKHPPFIYIAPYWVINWVIILMIKHREFK